MNATLNILTAHSDTATKPVDRPQPDRPRTPLTLIAMVAPPVNGNTVVSKKVYELTQQRCHVRLWNLSPGGKSFGAWFRARKAVRVARFAMQLVFGPRAQGTPLYLTCDDRLGLYFTLLLSALARHKGYTIFLHHHVYRYILRRDWRVAWIDQILSDAGAHLFLCCHHAKDFQEVYGSGTEVRFLPATITTLETDTEAAEIKPRPADKPFALGMISILMMEKGLAEVAQTLKSLRDAGENVVLHLAGPFYTPREEAFVRQLCAEQGEAVQYWGPVYGEDKDRFFRSIDVLLFPTRYKSEVQPVVISEAFSAGVPVVTLGRACIPWLVGDSPAGVALDPASDFVAHATEIIAQWIHEPHRHLEARRMASERARQIRKSTQQQVDVFLNELVKSCRDVDAGAKVKTGRRDTLGEGLQP